MDLLDDLILLLPSVILLAYETIVFCEIANIKHIAYLTRPVPDFSRLLPRHERDFLDHE